MIHTLLNNRYLIEAELGRGGMGVVYAAHDNLLMRDVAVKVLWSSSLGSQGRARLLREAQAAAKLNHPNIINIFDAGDAEGLSYIVMELLDGASLFEERPATLHDIVSVVQQICDALEHAHNHGIIHRDLKPENVIVTSKGVAKLTDFGLSRSLTGRISQEGVIVGTVYYLAPEQALRQDIDARADLYALGVLIYELITGRLPFTADDPLGVISQHLNAPVVPPSTYNPEIPPSLDALVLRLMNKRPEDRPQTASAVRDALDHLFDVTDLPPDILAGLSPLDRLARGRLVGRQVEFDRAKDLWRDVLSAYGGENVLVVRGEPGIGKTPLLKEINSLAQVSGARALVAECYARGTAPYSPVIQMLRALEPLPEGLPDLVVADLHTLAPDVIARPVPVNPPLTPLSEQQRLLESLFSLFATLAERQPMVLFVEDAHWADSNSLLFLRHLARRARATHLKLMIVLSARPVEMEDNRALKDILLDLTHERLAMMVDMLPFNREQTRELLTTMFTEAISDAFVDAVYQVTEGNLFFIEEICKSLIEEGRLSCDGGHWHFQNTGELELPQSIRSALQMRVTRLPAQVQEVLRLASVIGREFDYETLRRACDQNLDEDALIDALEQAQRAQLIEEVSAPMKGGSNGGAASGALVKTSEQFLFAHTLIPSILREEVSNLRRHRLHRRIAQALEETRPDDLEALAYHFGQAGDAEKARHYTIHAGDRARKLYANEEALRLYDEALALTPPGHRDRFHILASRARVYDILARRDLQREDIHTMVELAEEINDDLLRCDALIALADLLLVTEIHRAKEPARRAAEIAQRMKDPVREGQALKSIGWSAYHRQDFHESLTVLETAVNRFRQAGMLAQAAECLHMLSLVTSTQGLGEMEISRKYSEDAIQISRLAGDPRQEAIALRRLAIIFMELGEYEKALENAREALTLHRELGDRYEECMGLNAVGAILNMMSRTDEAHEYQQQALDIALAIHSSLAIWMIFTNIQWLYYVRRGMVETALHRVDEMLSRPDTQTDPYLLANFLEHRADLLSLIGQYGQALKIMNEVYQTSRDMVNPAIHSGKLVKIAYCQAEMGLFAEARASLEEARTLVQKFNRPTEAAFHNRIDAEIARREWEAGSLPQIHRAAAQIDQALTLLRGTRWTQDLALALKNAAWIALDRNKPEQALAYAEEAYSLITSETSVEEEFEYVLVCALWANGRDDDAYAHLETAYRRVMEVANHTKDEELRRSWLEDVGVNRQIIRDWSLYHV